jgi:hypothetical protein
MNRSTGRGITPGADGRSRWGRCQLHHGPLPAFIPWQVSASRGLTQHLLGRGAGGWWKFDNDYNGAAADCSTYTPAAVAEQRRP